MTVDKKTQQQQQPKHPKERMAGAEAQCIQASQAKSGADMTSASLPQRAQPAGDKHEHPAKYDHAPKEPKELQRGAKHQQFASGHDQQCASGQKQECAGETECASAQTEWTSSGKPQPMQQTPQPQSMQQKQMPQAAGASSGVSAGAAAGAGVKATLQDQAAAKK